MGECRCDSSVDVTVVHDVTLVYIDVTVVSMYTSACCDSSVDVTVVHDVTLVSM